MTCAKRRVVAVIYDAKGRLIGVGENECNKPQDECPRGPGEGYHKCYAICRQPFHAEGAAVAAALFGGGDTMGGRCVILGHTRCCEDCRDLLTGAGITDVVFA